MSVAQKRERHGGNRGAFIEHREIKATEKFYSSARAPSLPRNWRERLPDPASYYATHIEKLSKPNGSGFAQGRCPFHDDSNASLSVNVKDARGGWRCFAGCGGGDLIGFHLRLTGKQFNDGVRELIGGAR